MTLEKQLTDENVGKINYKLLEEMESRLAQKAQETEKALDRLTQKIEQKSKLLSMETKRFAQKLAGLEQLLREQRENFHTAALRYEDFCLCMERKAAVHQDEINERDRQIGEYRKQIEAFVQEREQAKKEIATLRHKSQRYDQVKKGLDQLRLQAELKAGKLVEDAYACARDAMDQVDDAVKQIQEVKEEPLNQEEPVESRLETFYRLLDETVEKLVGMREQFFIKNHIPPEPVEKAPEE